MPAFGIAYRSSELSEVTADGKKHSIADPQQEMPALRVYAKTWAFAGMGFQHASACRWAGKLIPTSLIMPPVARRYAKMWAFAGMGFIISVGYMDPGNWATDITAGSSAGYVLLVAVLLASITAMFLQVRHRTHVGVHHNARWSPQTCAHNAGICMLLAIMQSSV